MGKGIRPYYKYLVQDLGAAGTGYVNIRQHNLDLLIDIPLISTGGNYSIDLSMIYSYERRNESGNFAKGFRINTWKNIIKSGSNYNVTNHDGSVDIFKPTGIAKQYFNDESQATLVDNFNSSLDRSNITITDKYGNYYRIDYELNAERGRTISNIKGLYMQCDNVMITNYENENIYFTSNTIEYKVKYNGTTKTVFTIVFTVDSFGNLTKMRSYKYDNTTSFVTDVEFLFDYTNNFIEVFDNHSKKTVKYFFRNNRVTYYLETYNRNYTNAIKTSYISGEKYSMIMNYKDIPCYVHQDLQYRNICECDDKLRSIGYKYNSRNLLTQKTSLIVSKQSVATNLGNRIYNGYFSSGTTGWTTNGYCTIKVVNYGNSLLGTNALEVMNQSANDGIVTYTLNQSGNKGDKYTFALWYRQVDYQATNYISGKAKIKLINNNTVVDEGLIEFINNEMQDETMVFGFYLIQATNNYNTIRIELIATAYSGYNIFQAVQLYSNLYGKIYVYDNKNNLINTITQSGANDFTYTSSGIKNLLETKFTTDSTYINIQHDSKGNITKTEGAYRVETSNVYDINNAKTSSEIKAQSGNYNGKRLLSTGSYNTARDLLISSIDELGNTNSYDYDFYNKNLISFTDSISNKNSYFYLNDDKIDYQNTQDSTLTKNTKIDYNYDIDFLQNIKIGSSTSYERTKNSSMNITNIYAYSGTSYINDLLLVKYEYELETVGGITYYTGNLNKKIYGNNGDWYEYVYDSYKKIIGIKYGKSNNVGTLIFSYDYDDFDRVKKVTNLRTNKTTSYVYDSLGRLNEENFNDGSIIGYSYDNLNGINQKYHNISGKIRFSTYDYTYRGNGMNPEAFYLAVKNRNSKNYLLFTCFFNEDNNPSNLNYNLTCHKNNTIYSISPSNGTNNPIVNNDYLRCMNNLSTQAGLSYKINVAFATGGGFGIGYWFKAGTSLNGQHLFSVKQGNNKIVIRINSNNKIDLIITNSSGISTTKANYLTNSINVNAWNFFAFC